MTFSKETDLARPAGPGEEEVPARTLTDDFLELRVGRVQQSVRLERLSETLPGDVFFIIGAPDRVYLRSPREPRWDDDYFFIEMEDDCWRKIEHVGTGDPRQRVMVIHNTRE